jgi:hypothetical protein
MCFALFLSIPDGIFDRFYGLRAFFAGKWAFFARFRPFYFLSHKTRLFSHIELTLFF